MHQKGATMNDQWRQEKRGDFGWSVEGAAEIKAFWLAKAAFADPDAKVSGKIAVSTARMLEQKVAEHAAEITPHPNLSSAIRSGSLTAFGIADKLGGGYLIVFPAGLMNFQTLGTEGRAPSPRPASKQGSSENRSSTAPSAVATSRTVGFSGWLRGLFSFSPAAKLASRLASNDDATFVSALTDAVQYGPRGDDLGIRAMEEAMRRRAGRRNLTFLQPNLGGLTGRAYSELEDAPKRLLQLAEARALLRDPRVSQDLMSACLIGHGAEMIRECMLKAAELGGVGECYAFQLLHNHLSQAAKLAHARGARSWTEQMTDESK